MAHFKGRWDLIGMNNEFRRAAFSLVQRYTLAGGWPGLVAGGGGEGEKRNRFHLIIEHYNRLAQLPPPFLHPSAVARNQPPVRDYAKVKVDRYPRRSNVKLIRSLDLLFSLLLFELLNY